MPYTVNGIGTHYYGKSNRQQSAGICENCHNHVELQSYETRTWFCVIFIPIIPLGKKQILDYCPQCTTHRAMPFNKWQTVKNEAIQESATELQEDQESPEAGLQMMQTLAAFKKTDEATKLAHVLRDKHPDNAKVQFGVGGWLEHVGESATATECFEAAYNLEPDELAYKRAWGMTLAEKGQLNDARELLIDLEPGQETYDPSVMFFLASQCQAAGDHIQAIEIYGMVLEANPELGKNKDIRKMVLESERAIGSDQSILPRKGIPKKAFAWAAGIAAILAGFTWFGFNQAKSRRLVVLNGGGVVVSVQIDDQKVDVPALGRVVLTMPEGEYNFQVLKPDVWADQQGSFDIETAFFDRFGGNPCFVLDPAKCSVYSVQQLTYAVNDADSKMTERVFFGETFRKFDDIDYLFKQFPDSVRTKKSQVVKTRLDGWFVEPSFAVQSLTGTATPQQQLNFTERHLRATPNDPELLKMYGYFTETPADYQRAYAFLKAGLDRRPIEVDWHRQFQSISRRIAKPEDLVTRYDALLKANPNDSSALYLRGRIDPDIIKSAEYLDKAIKADATNYYAWHARTQQSLSTGDFAGAKVQCQKAQELRPDEYSSKSMMWKIQMGLRDYDALETELLAILKKQPINMTAFANLMILYGTKDEGKKMTEALNTFQLQVRTQMPGDQFQFLPHSERYVFYGMNKHDRAEAAINKLKQGRSRDVLMLQCWLEQGKFDQIKREMLPNSPTERAILEMYMYLGQHAAGESELAQEWYKSAIEDLENGDDETKRVATVLKTTNLDDAELELSKISMESTERMVVSLVVATMTEGASRRRLIDLVNKLNHSKTFPYFLVKRSLAAMNKPIQTK